ncbi:MAG: putative 2OG-Fe(II) oxygenase [Pseudomonadota bacterium]
MAKSPGDLVRAAQALHAAGNPLEAAEALAAAIELNPDDPVLYHNLAATLGDAGRAAAAVEALETGFKKGLDAPESLLVYARALAGDHRYVEAAAAYERLLGRAPIDETAHRELAQLVWMRTNDRKLAFAALDQAIANNPNAFGLFVLRAQLHGQTEDPGGEYQLLCAAIDRFGPQPILDYAASKAALACGDAKAGLLHGERVARNAPNEEQAQAAYCAALVASGDLNRAQDVLDGLRARFPDNQYYIALQTTLWRLGDDPRCDDLMDYDAFVFRARLDTPKGWPTLDAYLDDLIAALDARHAFKAHPFFQSVRRGSQIASITEADDAAMRAFQEAIEGPKRAFIGSLGQGADPLRRRNAGDGRLVGAWSILLPPNGYHVNHVHPEGWISTACHLRFDAEPEDEPHAGWLKFGEPGVLTPTPLPPERFVAPERGVLVMFPSYMWHGVVAYSRGGKRLTVAGDIVPAG